MSEVPLRLKDLLRTCIESNPKRGRKVPVLGLEKKEVDMLAVQYNFVIVRAEKSQDHQLCGPKYPDTEQFRG